MDCSVMDTGIDGVQLVQSTDFFYPLVDDPYLMGQIACANVLSDLYAQGISQPTNMLQLLGVSMGMDPLHARIVTIHMMRGFRDKAREAGTVVTGGQSVRNPWTIIGGVVSAVVHASKVVWPTQAQVGDVLVLTKPLGTQVAVLAYNWWLNDEKRARLMAHGVSKQDVDGVYAAACASMARLNKTAAELMQVHGARAATDITGFGLLGHAANLVSNQHAQVSFVIDAIPVFAGADDLDAVVDTKLTTGKAIETSGGLLIALPPSTVTAFCNDMYAKEGHRPAVVGRVVEGTRHVILSDKMFILT